MNYRRPIFGVHNYDVPDSGEVYVPDYRDSESKLTRSNDTATDERKTDMPKTRARINWKLTDASMFDIVDSTADDERKIDMSKVAKKIAKDISQDVIPDGTALKWQRKFDDSGKVYSYAAIKTSAGWFLTDSNKCGLTYSELVTDHLSNAVEGSIKVATEWADVR